MFLSKTRAVISGILSIILVILAMNLIERNIEILANRTTGRIVFDYALNIVIFFIVIYLVLSLFVFIFFRTKK